MNRKWISYLLVACLLAVALPFSSALAEASPTSYVDADGESASQDAYSATSSTVWDQSWYYVCDDDGTDDGAVTIDGTITLAADVSLILTDDVTLTVNGTGAGITDSGSGYSLTVYAQAKGNGRLILNGAPSASSSAGSDGLVCALLTVYGGRVEAYGGDGSDESVDNGCGGYSGSAGGNGIAADIDLYGGSIWAQGGAGGDGGAGTEGLRGDDATSEDTYAANGEDGTDGGNGGDGGDGGNAFGFDGEPGDPGSGGAGGKGGTATAEATAGEDGDGFGGNGGNGGNGGTTGSDSPALSEAPTMVNGGSVIASQHFDGSQPVNFYAPEDIENYHYISLSPSPITLCSYNDAVSAPADGAVLEIRLNGKSLGWCGFKAVDGGWKLYQSPAPGSDGMIADPYLAVVGGKLIHTDIDHATVWQYKNGAFFTTVTTTTVRPTLYGMLCRLFSFGRPVSTVTTTVVETDYYYLSSLANGAKAATTFTSVTLWTVVEADEHLFVPSTTPGKHICQRCGEVEDCVYDDYRCICGAIDPGQPVPNVHVTVSQKKTGFLFWKKTTYTANIAVSSSGYPVQSVAYATDGTHYTNGSGFTSSSPIRSFGIRVTVNGKNYVYAYRNGTVLLTDILDEN